MSRLRRCIKCGRVLPVERLAGRCLDCAIFAAKLFAADYRWTSGRNRPPAPER